MLNVRMGQKHSTALRSRYRQIYILKNVFSLLHTAIHQKIVAVYFQKRTTTRYFVRSADKLYVHSHTPSIVCYYYKRIPLPMQGPFCHNKELRDRIHKEFTDNQMCMRAKEERMPKTAECLDKT